MVYDAARKVIVFVDPVSTGVVGRITMDT